MEVEVNKEIQEKAPGLAAILDAIASTPFGLLGVLLGLKTGLYIKKNEHLLDKDSRIKT